MKRIIGKELYTKFASHICLQTKNILPGTNRCFMLLIIYRTFLLGFKNT